MEEEKRGGREGGNLAILETIFLFFFLLFFGEPRYSGDNFSYFLFSFSFLFSYYIFIVPISY